MVEGRQSYSGLPQNNDIELSPLTHSTSEFKFEQQPSHISRLTDPKVLRRELLQAARDGWHEKFGELLQFIGNSQNIKWSRGNRGVTSYGATKRVVICDVNDLLNTVDDTQHTILHYAARFNRFKILLALLRTDKFVLEIDAKTDEGYTPLHYAARYISVEQNNIVIPEMSEEDLQNFSDNPDYCSVASIKMLIDYGTKESHDFDINATDKYDQTALHHACLRGNYFAVEELLKHDVDVDKTDNQNSTALHFACERGYTTIVKLLVEKTNILLEDFEGSTPFHLATVAASEDIFQILCKKLVTGTSEQIDCLRNNKDSDGHTVLHTAVLGGNKSCVNQCLRLGFRLDEEDNDGAQCIHLAAQLGRVNIAEILLSTKRQDLSSIDRSQNTPLHYAARYNRENMIKFLLRRGSDPNAQNLDSNTPFMVAASFGNVLAVKEFLKHANCKIDIADRYGKTALFHAIEKDEDLVVAEILNNQFGKQLVNEKTNEDMTPLHAVAKQGDVDILNLLLKTDNCEIFSQNDEEQTPLHVAALHGNAAIVRRLLEYAGEKTPDLLWDEDEYSNHALHLACQEGQFDVVEILIEYQASITTINSNKYTPLHLAAASGHVQVAEYLIQEEAPIDGDEKNKVSTPLLLACQAGHTLTVTSLLKHGADICKHEDGAEIGNNALDLAIDAGNEEVVEILIQHHDIRKALNNYTGTNEKPTTPLRKLITKMPLQAHKVLSLYMRDNIKEIGHTDDVKVKVDFNFEILDDVIPFQEFIVKYEEENNIKQPLLSNLYEKGRLKKEFHPLSIMVDHARLDLLKHPLIRTMIRQKWKTHARYLYYGNLLIYVIFVLLLTLFTYIVPSCDIEMNRTRSPQVCISSPGPGRWYGDTYGCDGCDTGRVITSIIFAALIILFAIFRLLFESGQIIGDIKNYFTSLDNYIEWFIYIGAIVFVSDVFSNRQESGACGYQRSYIWELGAFVVLLAWFNLAVFLRKLPLLGIYILMLLHVIVTFFRIMLLGLIFIIGFSVSFYMVFRQGDLCNQYRNPFSTFLKTVVMMAGEFEFDGLFNDISNTLDHPISSSVLWLIFVILIPIILANLLVGLAVDDIKGVQETAVLKRLALHVELVLNFEETFPFSTYSQRKKNLIKRKTLFPNKKSIFERISYVFGGQRSELIQDIVEALGLKKDRIDVLSNRTLTMEKNLFQMKRLLRKVESREENIESMLIKLTKKLISEEEKDVY
ncbi:Transient receptor potential cation channel [Oopsacas minuta]|uniref:Transient receptor potential cation channel n=1 Tax=Oopsacas minuta TaxID=111878 RepID=A0AAV7JPV4_9METZ|nr:Transient receptor potential cation channel [Oopsacas minuta]